MVCTALFLCSVRCVSWPKDRSKYWFPATQKKGGCSTKVLSRPNQNLLIMLGWLLLSGGQFCVQPAYELRPSSIGVQIKSRPGTFVLTRLNKLGINEWQWGCISFNNQHKRPPPPHAELYQDIKPRSHTHKWERTPAHSHACARSHRDVTAVGCSSGGATSRSWLLMATGSWGDIHDDSVTPSQPAFKNGTRHTEKEVKWIGSTHTHTHINGTAIFLKPDAFVLLQLSKLRKVLL